MKWCLLLLLCFPFTGFAQRPPVETIDRSIQPSRYLITAEWQSLYSTHSNFFHGVSLLFQKQVSPAWRTGVGLEYSYSPYHDDNGWKLYHLKFLPLLADVQYRVVNKKKGDIFLQLTPGFSFISYDKAEESSNWKPYPVHETGLYLYAGSGVHVNVAKNLQTVLGLGIKGFHMSFNNLDVNPHGLVGRAGLQYRFSGAL